MPSLSLKDLGGKSPAAGGQGFVMPWKALLGISMIVFGVGYGWYQYERYNPSRLAPKTQAAAKSGDSQKPRKEQRDALQLTDEQKKQVRAINKETSNPQARRAAVYAKVLTPDQRALRDEQDAKVAARKKAAQEKRTRLFGGEAQIAAAKEQQIAARRQARKATREAKPTPATLN